MPPVDGHEIGRLAIARSAPTKEAISRSFDFFGMACRIAFVWFD
jgi:hypothetical protein